MDAKKLNDGLRVEEPWEFPAASFGMHDPKQEARLVSKLKHDPRARVIDRYGGLDLIKVDRTIFIEDERGLAYFVEWEDCNDFILQGVIAFAWPFGGGRAQDCHVLEGMCSGIISFQSMAR